MQEISYLVAKIGRVASDVKNGIAFAISATSNANVLSLYLCIEAIEPNRLNIALSTPGCKLISTSRRVAFAGNDDVTKALGRNAEAGDAELVGRVQSSLIAAESMCDVYALELCKLSGLEPACIKFSINTAQECSREAREALGGLLCVSYNELKAFFSSNKHVSGGSICDAAKNNLPEEVGPFAEGGGLSSSDFSSLVVPKLADPFKLQKVAEAPIFLSMAEKSYFYVFSLPCFGVQHYAIFVRDPLKDKSPLVRVHSSCYTGDILSSLACDCRGQLHTSLAKMNSDIAYNGGILLYISHEGRGIGLANKIKTYSLQQQHGFDTVDSNLILGFEDDERAFEAAYQMLSYFGIEGIDLLTNNKGKTQKMEASGIKVNRVINSAPLVNQHNERYLASKQNRMGHTFDKA